MTSKMLRRYLVVMLISMIIFFIIVCIILNKNPPNLTVYRANDVVKTVAHVGLDDKDYELIYEDKENDIAYYRYIGDRVKVKSGDFVYTCNNDKVKVLDTDTYGFSVEYNNTFYPGMSGTPMYDSVGQIIGYVSELNNSESVRCIWN